MYYQEKVINGVMHYRGHPNDEWKPMTVQQLTDRLVLSKLNLNNALRELRDVTGRLERAA